MSQNRASETKFITDDMEEETFKKSTFAYSHYRIALSRQWTRKHLWHHRNFQHSQFKSQLASFHI
eukprot:209666-Ditylum_brightwellii.AAC.2